MSPPWASTSQGHPFTSLSWSSYMVALAWPLSYCIKACSSEFAHTADRLGAHLVREELSAKCDVINKGA